MKAGAAAGLPWKKADGWKDGAVVGTKEGDENALAGTKSLAVVALKVLFGVNG